MVERTLNLRIETDNRDWKRNLDIHLGMLANESDASIQIYELNETGAEEANKILITTDINTKK